MKKTQEEKSAIRRKREQKELAKWEKELNRPKGEFYYWYLSLIITLVYMVDEITSQIGTQMQTEIAIGLFADRMSIMNALSAATFPLIILSVLYKTLSDRYGRRLFLCINTLGMGIGLFLVFLAGKIGDMGGIITYIAATAVINFFVPNDTQLVYIMETADKNKRGTMYSIIKSIATVSVMLIPFMRKAFMGDDVTKWENVYIVLMFLALVAAIMCFTTPREPDVFFAQQNSLSQNERRRKRCLKECQRRVAGKRWIGKSVQICVLA